MNHIKRLVPSVIACTTTVACFSTESASIDSNSNSGNNIKLQQSSAHTAGAITQTPNIDELARMHELLRVKNDSRIVVESIRVDEDEVIDCVDVRLQHGFNRPIATFASPPAEAVNQKDSLKALLGKEATTGQRYGTLTKLCPAGTVPRLHESIETLSRFKSLEDYFRKTPPAEGQPDFGEPLPKEELQRANVETLFTQGPTDPHQYAAYRQYVANSGAESILNMWSPYTELNSEFSLSQIWVANGIGANTETVEAGWQVYRQKYGSATARLFIYFTPDNYGGGGCYNNDCMKFTQVDYTIALGASFSNYSTSGGTQYAVPYRMQMNAAGDWWLQVNYIWVGYWEHGLFDGNGIGNNASRVTFGGEIMDHRNLNLHTSTDMGSGAFASSGFGHAAYQRNMVYYFGSTSSPSIADTNASVPIITGAGCYDGATYYDSDSWRRYMYFGGAGHSYLYCE